MSIDVSFRLSDFQPFFKVRMVNIDINEVTLRRCARAINRLGGAEVHLPIDVRPTPVQLVFAFVPCTDLAVSGARWFRAKRERDPDFQQKAVQRALDAIQFAKDLGAEWMVENPVSVLANKKFLGKPNYTFHPYEYGGYLDDNEADHPLYPDYIAPKDAYSKKTCLWTSDGFVMPEKKPVACESYGNSRQHSKLGGKSEKTKTIRSLTPRGFAKAVYMANR